jgi:hypothetical protein
MEEMDVPLGGKMQAAKDRARMGSAWLTSVR